MGDNDGLELRVPPLPPRYRLKDVILGDHAEDDRQAEFHPQFAVTCLYFDAVFLHQAYIIYLPYVSLFL